MTRSVFSNLECGALTPERFGEMLLDAAARLRDDEMREIDPFIEAHPDGASWEEIGEALGITAAEALKTAQEAIAKIQRSEGEPVRRHVGERRRAAPIEEDEPAVEEPVDDALREELLSPAGLRLHALADAMDHRVRLVHQIVRGSEVAMQPRRWYGPTHSGFGVRSWLAGPDVKPIDAMPHE